MSGIRRDAADHYFSLCVRERANFTCEHTGLVCPDGQASGKSRIIEAAHIWGRRSRNVRWEPNNAVALCTSSHRYFTERPMEFADFCRNLLGDGALELLREKVNDLSIKFTKAERKAIAAHYRDQYQTMRKRRDQGEQGRIEFVGYN